MKNWIIIAFLLVAGIGLGIGVTAIYSTKQTSNKIHAESVAQQQRVQASIAQTKREQADAQKDARIVTLQSECGKGLTAYNALTATQKKSLAAPVCN